MLTAHTHFRILNVYCLEGSGRTEEKKLLLPHRRRRNLSTSWCAGPSAPLCWELWVMLHPSGMDTEPETAEDVPTPPAVLFGTVDWLQTPRLLSPNTGRLLRDSSTGELQPCSNAGCASPRQRASHRCDRSVLGTTLLSWRHNHRPHCRKQTPQASIFKRLLLGFY